jgi:hypothetical protein
VRQNILKQTVLIQLEADGGVIEATLQDLVEARKEKGREPEPGA